MFDGNDMRCTCVSSLQAVPIYYTYRVVCSALSIVPCYCEPTALHKQQADWQLIADRPGRDKQTIIMNVSAEYKVAPVGKRIDNRIHPNPLNPAALYNTELNMLMCCYEWKELED